MNGKIIKKSLNIGVSVLGIVLILLSAFYFVLQSPAVQTYLVGKLTDQLSRKYHTSITIKGVSVSFFNKIVLDGVLVKDQQNDSLLYVDELVASIHRFSIKKHTASISKLKLDHPFIKMKTDSAGKANYQFLVDLFSSKDTLSPDVNYDFDLKQLELENASVGYAYVDTAGNHQIDLRNITLGVSDMVFQNNNISFLINNLQLDDHKDFKLEEFSAHFLASGDSINLLKMHAMTSNSEITNLDFTMHRKPGKMDFAKMKVSLDLKKSSIGLKDVGILVPVLKGMEEKIDVSGQISGTLADLKGKDITLSLGDHTQLAFDFYLNGLPHIEETYMHVDLKQSFADFKELGKVKLPASFPLTQLKLPSQLQDAGIIEYQGNFTGFLSDFVAYGTFKSKWGVVTTDLSFVPSEGEKLKVNGKVQTINFQMGQLFQTDLLNDITFNGNIQGILNQYTNNFSAKVKGKIDSVWINAYEYRNIQLNGDVYNKKFDGNVSVNDPNLKLNFDGQFDLNVPIPVFNFEMQMDKADLKALNLDHTYKQSQVSFALNANFTGNSIDNLDGSLQFTKGTYKNENDSVAFNNINIKTFYEDEPVLLVRSDFLDADIEGDYELHNLHNSIKQIISKYLPSAGFKAPLQKTFNNFDFKFDLKDINRFTRAFIPALKINPSTVEGRINSVKGILSVKASFPEIQYESVDLHNLTVDLDGDTKLNLRNKVENISIGDKFTVYNLSVISEAGKDVLDSKVAWNNFGAVSYSGSVSTSTRFFKQKEGSHVEISVKPTKIFIADSLWQINPALVTIDSTQIKVDQLKFSNNGQAITVDGSINKNQDEKINVNFNEIDLSWLNNFVEDIDLHGKLDGSLSIFDIYHKSLFLSNLQVNGLSLLGQPMGDAQVQSYWDPASKEINAELNMVSDNRKTLVASGIYIPEKDSLSVNTNFDHFSILILQPLLGSSFANVHGDATGKVHVYGPLNHIMHDGALFASKAGLMLSDLQVNYNLNDSVRFVKDKIVFPQMKVYDDFGNSGVFDGSIQHRSFSKMIYDLSVKSNRLMVFNTTPTINEQFYGKLYGSGIVRITGKGANVYIDGNARTEKGTDMNIYLEYTGEAQEYDFLSFVKHGYHALGEKKLLPGSGTNLQMKFNVEVTPDAKAQLIYNSKIGDVIRGQGSGDLQLNIDNNNDLTMYGQYTVEQGDYLFTLQNVINKKFEIQQGGTIQWNGDPYNAVIDLNAIYRLKASLSELFENSYNEKTQRIPVLCKINLSRNLLNPDIKFDIELPTTEDRTKDVLSQFINSEEDMNKQMLSLLVLGKFYTSGASNKLAGSTATTASELLSNQFSNWLSQISKDFDVGVNYRPGDQITNDEVELALSTQMFNNRVTINGNIANNGSQKISTNNNNGLVGDADINVKLTRNGKLQLKAYNHANNNIIYETSPYKQGVGLSYREDFNDFKEFWQKLKNIFKQKNNKSKPIK
ncbi:MAG: translocation/assembly module TamB domain-containing protein [Candidatus Saccharibacteria bacterium]